MPKMEKAGNTVTENSNKKLLCLSQSICPVIDSFKFKAVMRMKAAKRPETTQAESQ
jgi:hypothetical protein